MRVVSTDVTARWLLITAEMLQNYTIYVYLLAPPGLQSNNLFNNNVQEKLSHLKKLKKLLL